MYLQEYDAVCMPLCLQQFESPGSRPTVKLAPVYAAGMRHAIKTASMGITVLLQSALLTDLKY